MAQYYKQLALAMLMMTTLGLSSCKSKSKDEPTIKPTSAFVTPGGWVNGANGYVEPYHNPAYPNSPYFTREEAERINAQLKASGSKLYLPNANELARYFPRPALVDGVKRHLITIGPREENRKSKILKPDIVETVQFGRYATPIQAKSTFLNYAFEVGSHKPDINYAIRFYDQPQHRVFQRWSFKLFQREIFGKTQSLIGGVIAFLPYEESATIGGENAPVFTEEYWERRTSEVKSITVVNWGLDKPGSPLTFGDFGFYHGLNCLAVMSSLGMSLGEQNTIPGVIHLFEEGK